MIITGTNAPNTLVGSASDDRISGLGGADTILAGSGADVVAGGQGDDRISGGEGSDTVTGGFGNDVIFGYGSTDVQPATADIGMARVGGTFSRPVFATSAPGDPDRLYVVEQHTGRVMILDTATGQTKATPFLDLPDASLAHRGEQGLLGLAFDPDYATNGRLYVSLTRADGDVVLRAYTRSASNPDTVRPGSADALLVIDRDNGAFNHNGGWIGFGEDGMLYMSVGDEGLAGDPANNAQDIDSLWGKMLRLDMNGDDFAGDANRDYAIPDDNPFAGKPGADEIWALGLRNAWRNGFDRQTGDLYIADVGQALREEINVALAGSAGGANYGWKVKEGELVYDDGVPGNPDPESPALTDPVVTYGHDASGGYAVIGGYVYRGTDAGMQGRYVYADAVTGNLWSFRLVDGHAVDVTDHTTQLTGGTVAGITSFAEDGHGNLYALKLDGSVSRLTFGAGSGDGADSLDGGEGHDELHGGAGADTLLGRGGHDTLTGGAQNDLLNGGAGNDVIGGNTGADSLLGGAGNDTLSGGMGNDTLAGGAGADTFNFGPYFGSDRIIDFEDDVDTLRLADAFGFDTVSEALGFARDTAAGVVFAFETGALLTVVGMTVATLSDDLVV